MESPLAAWQNYYVIVGSSAGALTGLQFVVIALLAESRVPGSMREVRAFGSPTIVHFGASLLIAAIMSAPWGTLHAAGIALAACGIAGVFYALNVVRHARLQTGYQPEAEDLFFYIVAPLLLYSVWTAAAILLAFRHTSALFAIAAVALFLLFLGIHNAWDSVTYIAIVQSKHRKEE